MMATDSNKKMNEKSRKHTIADEYLRCVEDLLSHEKVLEMHRYIQHSEVSCLEHSLYVSYITYLMCKRLGLRFYSAARGGLLHDFFLYDWHVTKPEEGLHGFSHPDIALRNANEYFNINSLEQDIIGKHMWPLTGGFPRHRETFVVLLADKYCTIKEVLRWKDPVLHELKRCHSAE